MPNVYKLAFATKEALEADLIAKGILTGERQYNQGTHAVVHLGNIVLEPATEEGEAVISDKYHCDIMVEGEFDFGENEVHIPDGEPTAHKFA
jgi:predicted phosphodiesterase